MPKKHKPIWMIHEKIGKQPWKLAQYFIHFNNEKEAKDQAKHMTEQHYRRTYRAVRYEAQLGRD